MAIGRWRPRRKACGLAAHASEPGEERRTAESVAVIRASANGGGFGFKGVRGSHTGAGRPPGHARACAEAALVAQCPDRACLRRRGSCSALGRSSFLRRSDRFHHPAARGCSRSLGRRAHRRPDRDHLVSSGRLDHRGTDGGGRRDCNADRAGGDGQLHPGRPVLDHGRGVSAQDRRPTGRGHRRPESLRGSDRRDRNPLSRHFRHCPGHAVDGGRQRPRLCQRRVPPLLGRSSGIVRRPDALAGGHSSRRSGPGLRRQRGGLPEPERRRDGSALSPRRRPLAPTADPRGPSVRVRRPVCGHGRGQHRRHRHSRGGDQSDPQRRPLSRRRQSRRGQG